MVGELYNVDMKTLGTLDKLERHPTFYTRDALTATLELSSAELVQCEAYFMRNYRRDLLASETFISEYTDTAERRYVLPADRHAGVIADIKESL